MDRHFGVFGGAQPPEGPKSLSGTSLVAGGELRICRRRPWRGSKRLLQGRQPNGLGTLGAGEWGYPASHHRHNSFRIFVPM
jgi:hypothetical protein